MKHPKTFTAVATLVAAVAAAVVFALIFIYSGLYDVAAIRPHLAITEWVLSTTMDQSVRHHAKAVVVPGDFQQMGLKDGGARYRRACMVCHGAPGVERSEISRGLNPQPPNLQEAALDWNPAQLYWIVRSGVKMTGMPSFEPTHTEQQLWAITAFVKHLPDMSPSEYETLTTPAATTNPGQE